ncbi:MAG: peptide/nickel transport system permease protein [Actinomycetota bacterium]|jgi:peptide/nickel transport system permease protein|nr:peptide/nickel transport system permease protein [Actinomycetota bacterium]
MMETLHRLFRHKGAAFGVGVIALVVILAATASILYPDGPFEMVGGTFEPPFQHVHPLGTDGLGRDVLTSIVYGTRVSLLVAIISTVVAVTVGVLVGAVSGYYGGRLDDLIMRVTELFQTIPSFVFAVVLIAIFTPNIGSIVAAISVVSWPPVARLVRGEFLAIRHREYVEAAVVLGVSTPRIIFVEILPNVVSPVVVLASLMVANAILLEAGISFLGLGDQNLMSWGYMIGEGRSTIRDAWWLSVFPGIAVVATVLALNLIGDGLNDALNPRLARRGRA